MIDGKTTKLSSVPNEAGHRSRTRHDGKLFGIGLSRTGTTSLHAAAVLMGMSAVHYPLCYRNLAVHWLEGDFSPTHTAPFRCYTDLPTPRYFRELDRSHHGSKFVLTLRDETEWIESVERQHTRSLQSSPRAQLRHHIRALCFGGGEFDRARYLDVYRSHEAAVREYFVARPDALLVLDLTRDTDAWKRLAAFIGIDAGLRRFPDLRDPDLGSLSWVLDTERHAKIERLEKLVETG